MAKQSTAANVSNESLEEKGEKMVRTKRPTIARQMMKLAATAPPPRIFITKASQSAYFKRKYKKALVAYSPAVEDNCLLNPTKIRNLDWKYYPPTVSAERMKMIDCCVTNTSKDPEHLSEAEWMTQFPLPEGYESDGDKEYVLYEHPKVVKGVASLKQTVALVQFSQYADTPEKKLSELVRNPRTNPRHPHHTKTAIEFRFAHTSIPLTYQDIWNSMNAEWATDRPIDAFFALLSDICDNKKNYMFFQCHFCHFIYPEMNEKTRDQKPRWEDIITKSYKPYFGNRETNNPFQMTKLFIPLNTLNQHWSLLVVDMTNKKFINLDSMGTDKDTKKWNERVHLYLAKCADLWEEQYDSTVWQEVVPDNVPLQPDAWSCGYFVCFFAYCVATGCPFMPVKDEEHGFKAAKMKDDIFLSLLGKRCYVNAPLYY